MKNLIFFMPTFSVSSDWNSENWEFKVFVFGFRSIRNGLRTAGKDKKRKKKKERRKKRDERREKKKREERRKREKREEKREKNDDLE